MISTKNSNGKTRLLQTRGSQRSSSVTRGSTDRIDRRNPALHHCIQAAKRQIAVKACIFCIFLLPSVVAVADPAPIVGIWQIDARASGDPTKQLKGIRVSKYSNKPAYSGPEPNKGPLSDTQQRYWESANDGKERRYSSALAHAGPLQRLLESENLEIVPTDNGYLFIYADGYERSVVPNPGGRVFTASGDELVETDIGFTLAFWQDTSLRFETRIEDGGKLTELLTTSADGNRLTVSIEIDRRDWKWIVKLDRIFDRVLTNETATSAP